MPKLFKNSIPEACVQIAFEKFIIEYISRTCVISWGYYFSNFGMGNRARDKSVSSWYHYVNYFMVGLFWIMIQGFISTIFI